jgi:hypothetical protein
MCLAKRAPNIMVMAVQCLSTPFQEVHTTKPAIWHGFS